MKKLSFTFLLIIITVSLNAGISFSKFFKDSTLRIDYYHYGNAGNDRIAIDRFVSYKKWAGNPSNLCDIFNNGYYFYKVYDKETGRLIFSRGFNCYFGEYKLTPPAIKGTEKVYHESALIPFPKKTIIFTVEQRTRDNKLKKIFSREISPENEKIEPGRVSANTEIIEVLKNGNPHNKVDIVIVAEGYTDQEKPKLLKDLKRIKESFINHPPYSDHKEKFNITCAFRPSEESGVDEPTKKRYRSTAIDATFNSLGSPRYLLTENNRALRDIACSVPYDSVMILVNSSRYGGGGIYNFYSIFTSSNIRTPYLMHHEFGHNFAGLADEYYSSSVAYSEFYKKGVEPIEPNITALLKPGNIKWQELLTRGIKIPTEWQKTYHDKLISDYYAKNRKISEKISSLKKERGREKKINKLQQTKKILYSKFISAKERFFRNHKRKASVGAFEGAGYSSTGIYRPMLDCTMFSHSLTFCTVCSESISKMIEFYTK